MLKEYSYGAIIYKMEDGRPLFLLIKSKKHDKWGFPKGHVEEGETTGFDTAKREIFEETGIKDIKFINGFREEDIYITDGVRPETKGAQVQKHSIYFLAETFSDDLNYDSEEISQAKWTDFERAQETLYFENQKNMLKKAYTKIKELI
ncbi:MAG: NUDIX domain-containing protein [Endomicrobium sp.]|jgi:8-oxo-dGTP pyrophosphatase MutT (NUDIX family)|nr:NUDIX domain-containing protein [Endomicrobium sp.]